MDFQRTIQALSQVKKEGGQRMVMSETRQLALERIAELTREIQEKVDRGALGQAEELTRKLKIAQENLRALERDMGL